MQKCRFCRSEKTVKRGFRHLEKRKKQLYLCNSCKRKFTVDDGYLKMRHDKKVVEYAVRLYGNHSSSEVKDILRRKGIRVSRWTIIKWSKRF